jgi:transposase
MPDYNPVELLWRIMKSIPRKLKARTLESLVKAIDFALDGIHILFKNKIFYSNQLFLHSHIHIRFSC